MKIVLAAPRPRKERRGSESHLLISKATKQSVVLLDYYEQDLASYSVLGKKTHKSHKLYCSAKKTPTSCVTNDKSSGFPTAAAINDLFLY